MRGNKIEQAREAAIQVISGLNPGESFNIIAYSDTIDRFAQRAVTKTDESQTQAIDFIRGINAVGGTNIHDALLAALRAEPAEGTLPMVIFLTDGLPTVGVTQEGAIRDAVAKGNAHDRRVFGFGVGYDVNAPLLTAVSRATRGAPSFVLPQEDVEVKVGQVFNRLTGPVLASPMLTPSNPSHIKDMLPGELPDVFEGDQILVLGRYSNEDQKLRFTLAGRSGDTQREFELAFDPSRANIEHSFVPRLWAQRRIAQLVEAIRQAGADGKPELNEELVQEIVQLSTRWGILTEYTAFLAIEPGVDVDEQMRFGSEADDRDGMRRLRREVAASAAMPGESAPVRASRGLAASMSQRTGLDAVQQEAMNLFQARSAQVMSNRLQTAGGAQIVLSGMRQIADQTLFRRGGQWIDASLIEAVDGNNADVDEIIEFASERYFELAEELAAEDRQGLLALDGDVMLNRADRILLVRAPGAEAP